MAPVSSHELVGGPPPQVAVFPGVPSPLVGAVVPERKPQGEVGRIVDAQEKRPQRGVVKKPHRDGDQNEKRAGVAGKGKQVFGLHPRALPGGAETGGETGSDRIPGRVTHGDGERGAARQGEDRAHDRFQQYPGETYQAESEHQFGHGKKRKKGRKHDIPPGIDSEEGSLERGAGAGGQGD